MLKSELEEVLSQTQDLKLNQSQNPWSAGGASQKKIAKSDIYIVDLDQGLVQNCMTTDGCSIDIPALLSQPLLAHDQF